MTTGAKTAIQTLRNSHERLTSLTSGLEEAELTEPSYDTEWSIAQVLSHLGSQAEIVGSMLNAVLDGTEPPGRESFQAIWDVWDARSPLDQRDNSLASNARILERIEQLDASQLESLRIPMFGRDLDVAEFAAMRVSEHAVHTWDIAVSSDPNATVSADAVDLLIDLMSERAGRNGKPIAPPRELSVQTTDPDRSYRLRIGEETELVPDEAPGKDGTISLPSEALIRLIYGRLDAEHLGGAELAHAKVSLEELREVFPGF